MPQSDADRSRNTLATALDPGGGGFGAARYPGLGLGAAGLPRAAAMTPARATSNQVLQRLGMTGGAPAGDRGAPAMYRPGTGLGAGGFFPGFQQQRQQGWQGQQGQGGNWGGNPLLQRLQQRPGSGAPGATPAPAPAAPAPANAATVGSPVIAPGTAPTVNSPGATASGAYLPPTMETFAPTESWMGPSYGWDFPNTSATPPGYKSPASLTGSSNPQPNPLAGGPGTGAAGAGGVPQVGAAFEPPGRRAEGGAVNGGDDGQPEVYHGSGLIHSQVAGRTDRIPLSVAAGAYVLPADVVSGLGEGNTLSGAKVLDRMMHTGPFGMQQPTSKGGGRGIPAPPSLHMQKFARGGRPRNPDDMVKVIVAGGEYVVHPTDVVKWSKDGDLTKGHDGLDRFVKAVRKLVAEGLKKLPGPKV